MLLFTEPNLLSAWVVARKESYLADMGWFESYKFKKPLDSKGNLIPWITYPFYEFIKERLGKEMEVFEFGSGYSTLYYANLVKSIISVEHDKNWYQYLHNQLPGNAKVLLCPLEEKEKYFLSAETQNKKFHLIFVDGEFRDECVTHSLNALHETGVLILDDTERPEYLTARNFLKNNGFREIQFWGIAPGLFYRRATSVFYRNNNCLKI